MGFEATGNLGVGLCTWKEFMDNDWQSLYPELALRRVRFPRTAERLNALEKWCGQVNECPYSLSVTKLRQRNSVSQGGEAHDGTFFCSELCAEALKVLGVIPRGLASAQWWPSSFEAGQKAPCELEKGCSFGDELTLDFNLGSGASIRAGVVQNGADAEKKARDKTTNW